MCGAGGRGHGGYPFGWPAVLRDVTTQLRAVYAITEANSLRHFAPAAISGAASETTTSEKRHAANKSMAQAAQRRQASRGATLEYSWLAITA